MSDVANAYDAFLSYNWRDRTAVETVARALRDEGLSVFFDRWYLVPGRPWTQALETVLASCRACVVFLGPHGMGPWQQREKDLGLLRQTHTLTFPVIPVLLPNADPALGFLALNSWIDLRAGLDDPLQLGALTQTIRGEPPGPDLQQHMQATLATVCPYRGLRPFREEDAPFFFGREVFSARLTAAVERHAVVAVVGASGSGKSSVVRAGLLPSLRHGQDERVWDMVTVLPGEQPLHALAAVLVPLLEPDMHEVDRLAEARKLARYLREGDVSLQEVVNRVLEKQPGTDRLLLVVDQWEELYTLCQDNVARRRVLDLLLEATTAAPLTMVLTIRGDFFGAVLSYRPFADRLHDAVVPLGPMTHEELERVVMLPAQQMGLTFESGLVGRILDDVRDEPGNLPLLEFTLTTLWEERHGGVLLHAAYEAMGGVQGAMARRAEEAYARLTPVEQAAARRVFMQLIQLGAQTEDTRRRAFLGDIDATAQPVVRQLVDARLLVTGHDQAATEQTVEVAHEALIRNWTRLHQWIDVDREFLRWRQRLHASLEEWEHADHDEEVLLRGAPLAEAEHWLTTRPDDVSATERNFVQASIRRREQERSARERLRHRIIFGLVTAFLCVVILAGLAAVQWQRAEHQAETARHERDTAQQQRQLAEEQRRVALAGQLVAQAQLTRGQNPSLLPRSVLLALESLRLRPSVEAEQALRAGLALLPRPVARLAHDRGFFRHHMLAFTPDGRSLTTVDRYGTAYVWELQSGQEVARASPSQHATAIAFSPDGRYLAMVSEPQSTVSVVETGSGREMIRLHHRQARLVAFSGDARYLATASRDGSARVWEVPSAREIVQIEHAQGKTQGVHVTSLALSPDGRYLATGGTDQTARLWETETGKAITQFPHEEAGSSLLTFSPAGHYLVTAIHGGETAALWEVPQGREVTRVAHGFPTYDRFAVSFSPDDRYLATAGEDNTARIWDMRSGREAVRLPHGDRVRAVTFSPDGQYLATVSWDIVRLWHVSSSREVRRMVHEKGVLAATFSPDGTYVATASDDGIAWVWDTSSEGGVRRMLHSQTVNAAALSASAQTLVTVGDNGSATLWETTTGQEKLRLVHPGAWTAVEAVTFSPDERSLVTTAWDGTARTWNLSSGTEVTHVKTPSLMNMHALSPGGQYVAGVVGGGERDYAVVLMETASGRELTRLRHTWIERRPFFSPDGRYLATIGESHNATVRLWDTTRGQEHMHLVQSAEIHRVAFSADSRYIATANVDGFVQVWELPSRAQVTTVMHTGKVNAIALSADGQWLVTGGEDGVIRLWEMPHGREVAQMRHDAAVVDIVFSPDARSVATASKDHTVRLLEVPSLREIRRLPHAQTVWQVTFSPDGTYVGTRTDHRSLIWETRHGEAVIQSVHLGFTRDMTFSPSGRYVAVALSDGMVQVLGVPGGQLVCQVQHAGSPSRVSAVAFRADEQAIATGSGQRAHVWEADTGRERVRMYLKGFVTTITFSADGRYVITGDSAGVVQIWDGSTGQSVRQFDTDNGMVVDVAMSPDGRYLAAGFVAANHAEVWDVMSGTRAFRAAHGEDSRRARINAVAFSPSGTYLATAAPDGSVRLWEVASGQHKKTLPHARAVTDVAFSPDGNYLATASADHTVRLWDVRRAQEVTLLNHTSVVRSVAFSADGQVLFALSDDRTTWLWSLGLHTLMEEACARLTRNLTWHEWQKHLGAGLSYRNTCENLAVHPSVTAAHLQASAEFAQAGDLERARAQIAQAHALAPSLDPDSALREVARVLVQEAQTLATRGDVPGAVAKYDVARQLIPMQDFDPEVTARRIAVHAAMSQGIDLAKAGKIQEAVAKLRLVQRLDTTQNIDPEATAHQVAARALVEQGEKLASTGQIPEALSAYNKAKTLAQTVDITADQWNTVCWHGSILGHAAAVMEACEHAVTLGTDKAYYRDARGLARALTGNFAGAIDDFTAFVTWSKAHQAYETHGRKRDAWIAALQAGRNPFDAATLAGLRKE